MRLYEYVPVHDLIHKNESLIDAVFGPDFYVVGETGQLLTTAHNQNLLRRAKMLLEHAFALGDEELDEALHDLAERAENLDQGDYELAVGKEFREQDFAEDETPDR